MRVARALVLAFAVIVVAACGSSAGSSVDGGSSAPVGSSEASGAAPSPSLDAASPEPSQGGGGGGASQGAGGGDLSAIADQLVPPNSSETSKTTASGVIFVTYSSTDSPDTLKGFYEGQIGKVGWTTVSTTSTAGSYSWIISPDANGSVAGSITVAPDASGGNGSQVLIQLGTGS
jgi:hypothetical protein